MCNSSLSLWLQGVPVTHRPDHARARQALSVERLPRACATGPTGFRVLGPAQDGYMAADEFFIYKFSREQAGLSGLAFDEGQFGVFGYVTAVRALAQASAMRPHVH